jgi:hypothetical protein
LIELGDGSDWVDDARRNLEIMADKKSDLGTAIKRGLALL